MTLRTPEPTATNEKTSEEAQSSAQALNASEKDILDAQLHAPLANVSYFSLYQYATKKEYLIMTISALASVGSGAVMPLMAVVFGNFAGSFTTFASAATAADDFKHQVHKFALYFVYLGIGSLFTSFISVAGFSYTAERITQRIRELYLRAIFRQNIAFFDFLGSGEVTSRISADMNLVQDGISQKIGLFISGMSMFVAALMVGFLRAWLLAFIILATTVASFLVIATNGRLMRAYQTAATETYTAAGSVAEEAISSARNVTAYGAQYRMDETYTAVTKVAAAKDFRGKLFLALMIALLICLQNLTFGLAFWQGNRFLHEGKFSVAKIIATVMTMMTTGAAIAQNIPHLAAFGQAAAAAKKIFNTIDRKSPIDAESEQGGKPTEIVGNIQFKNVKHVYPSRVDATVLDDFSLDIPAGRMTALVGSSGSGKSTVFGLLERFYLPMSGEIFLDGREISTLNIRWLRSNMSIVSQDPVLFSTTIFESIEHGLVGTEYEHTNKATKLELIENAARMANAYDFIDQLPHKFHTRVGERGSLLSGGQKQRIAIARAIVSDPKILLLDEATASLDTRSESAVQEALDRASKGRTTIVVAHRLSTIKHADNIVVMMQGKIVEEGTHENLLQLHGVYNMLVQAQELRTKLEPGRQRSDAGEKDLDSVGEKSDEALSLSRTITTQPDASQRVITQKEKEYSTWQLAKFSWSQNDGEKGIMMIGFLFAILAGFVPNVQAIFFGNAINAFMTPEATTGHHSMSFWCLMLLMLGLIGFIFYAVQGAVFAYASAALVRRARERGFRSILRQDIEFFEKDESSSGALVSFLSTEANRLAGISGANLGSIVSSLATIIGALVIGISFGWKLALVCASCMPVLLSTGYFRFWSLVQLEKRTKTSSDAAAFACEAASSIRTVATLSLEQHLLTQYHEKLDAQAQNNLRFNVISSTLYALAQSLTFFIMALCFWYGSTLILDREYTVVQFFICYQAVIQGAQYAGTMFSFAPDMGAARAAAQLLKTLLSRVPEIDSWSIEGKVIEELEGKIELKDIRFTYPSRPDQRILRGVSLTAQPGQFIALVGASGSGKSTIMALLERFYDPISGNILIDDEPLNSYNLQSYRSHLAIVSQETTLYTGTIRENILADKDSVSEEALIQACKDANIHDFIASLPAGLDTLVGAKGQLLSGGQRQRLAIARALLRNPKILLLDEATSSLDSTSEAAVQAALDKAAKGRTTVAIAHRLSTIQGADIIYVFDKGKVVERGRHDELMRRRGVYWELGRLQALGA